MTNYERLTREEFEKTLIHGYKVDDEVWNWIEKYADQKAREAQIEVLEGLGDLDAIFNPGEIVEEKLQQLKSQSND